MNRLKLATEKVKYLLDEIQDELVNLYRQLPLHNEEKLCGYLEKVMKDYHEQLLIISQNIESRHESRIKTVKKIIKTKLDMPLKYTAHDKYYKYKKGTNPWDFHLSNASMRDMEKIDREIIEAYCFKEIGQFQSLPENGLTVIGSTGTMLFRALTIEKLPDITSCRLLNLDDGEIYLTPLNQIYEMPDNLKKRPPQTIRCTLAKDRFCKRFWAEEYSRFFKLIMEGMEFKFDILDQISIDFHPHYLIHLNGMLSPGQPKLTLDISRWIIDNLFPQMEIFSGDLKKVMKNVPLIYFEADDAEDISSISSLSSDYDSQDMSIDISITSISEFDEENASYEVVNNSTGSTESNSDYWNRVGGPIDDNDNEPLQFTCSYNFPAVDDTIIVCPQTIITGHVFYGHIIDHPDNYNDELKLLEEEINLSENIQRYEIYTNIPDAKELCLVLSDNGKWCRSRVIEVDHRGIHVFHVDYGRFETVCSFNMRKIKRDYLNLPPQGVRFELYGIWPIEDKKKDAQKFLRNSILNKNFVCNVKRRKLREQTLCISLGLRNNSSLQELLISFGYFEEAPNLYVLRNIPSMEESN
ncbi:hypothetical protein O3M35_004148 [Rhynocoris fuscipes]|uniref:Tudor domain-containing protein n=1 Tax=Rhynocoris fuscipes TaxID=488301 RepID=A0AAW1CMG6_9HEMI